MRVLAVVPARGGSRGIPRKNLVVVGGQPLVTWSIRTGLEAASVDRVVVSTDDPEIADVSRAAGAEVPFRRPAELAGDETADLPVFQHALAWLADHESYRPDVVVHLRPTSPARRPGLIDQGVARLLADADATSLRTVSPAPVVAHKLWWVTESGHLSPVVGTMAEELFNQPRQTLPTAWAHDGVLDVIRPEVIEAGSMSGPSILAMPLPLGEGVDVDRPEDLSSAEAALARLATGDGTPTNAAGDAKDLRG